MDLKEFAQAMSEAEKQPTPESRKAAAQAALKEYERARLARAMANMVANFPTLPQSADDPSSSQSGPAK